MTGIDMHNRRSYTLTETLVASVIIIMLITSTLGCFLLIKNLYRSSAVEYSLQRDVNAIMDRIIRGRKEAGGRFGLRSALSYTLPVTIPAGSDISFVHTDGGTRRYFLNGNIIAYISPTQSPNQQNIYMAPSGAALTLTFWEAAPLDPLLTDPETIGVYVALSRQIDGKTFSGSAVTYVNLRNVPK